MLDAGTLSVTEVPLSRYLQMLASADPVPGGGCAAAIAGAQGAALVAMAARVALRRAEHEEAASRLEQLARHADELARRLGGLAGEDAQAYHEVMRAYRLPRGTEREKETRQETIRQALARAAEVPFTTAQVAVEAMESLVELLPVVPSALLPDVGSAAWLLRACVEGCALSVRANWQSMRPSPVEGYNRLEALVGHCRRLFEQVRSRLGPLSNGGLPAGIP